MKLPAWKASEPAVDDARRVLPEWVHAYFAAGRKLTSESTPKAMHRFRLRTKRLRYTLDVFVELYGHGLKRRSAALRPIQNALGEANDCADLLKHSGGQLPENVRSWLVERAAQSREEFLRYWREEFDAAGEEKKWDRYLTTSARRVLKPAPKS